jgi:glyoxylase-like metal-dependent hydrolase (beta-lactamase superfamily II)
MSEYPAHIEIEPHVHLVRGENRGRFPEANCLLIDDEILTLVDAGASRRQIQATLHDLGHKMQDIERVVLTHFHVDHKGIAAEIQEESNCEIICHPLAVEGVETFDGLIRMYGIAGNQYFEDWKGLMKMRLPHVLGNYKVTGTFEDRKPISCGEVDLLPLHSPGHTTDHTCIGINGLKTLLLVDIDLTRFGPWYGNAVSDIQEFKSSIQRIIDLEPSVGISSHRINPITDDLSSELQRYLSIIDEREKRVLDNIAKGCNTLEQLASVPTIYPRIPYDLYMVFETFMLQKHIELSKKNGDITEKNGILFIEKR